MPDIAHYLVFLEAVIWTECQGGSKTRALSFGQLNPRNITFHTQNSQTHAKRKTKVRNLLLTRVRAPNFENLPGAGLLGLPPDLALFCNSCLLVTCVRLWWTCTEGENFGVKLKVKFHSFWIYNFFSVHTHILFMAIAYIVIVKFGTNLLRHISHAN